jgi:hypothetical protein
LLEQRSANCNVYACHRNHVRFRCGLLIRAVMGRIGVRHQHCRADAPRQRCPCSYVLFPLYVVQVYSAVQVLLPTPEGYAHYIPQQQQQPPAAHAAAFMQPHTQQQQGLPEPPPGASVTYNITHVTNNYGGGASGSYPDLAKGLASPGAAVSVYQEGYGAGLGVGPQPARVEGSARWGSEGSPTAPPVPGMLGYQQATY